LSRDCGACALAPIPNKKSKVHQIQRLFLDIKIILETSRKKLKLKTIAFDVPIAAILSKIPEKKKVRRNHKLF